mgnify:CR=1 FL=1
MSDDPYESLTAKQFFSAMSEHIYELRNRMIIGIIALIFGTILCLFFSEKLLEIICIPIGGIEKLRSIEITENISAVFRVVLLGGVILSFPVILYEIFAFILPALKANEKRLLFSFLPSAILFFLCGISFAYFLLLPTAIPFLTTFMGIETEVRPANYISFVTNMIFWVGVVFELPIMIYIPARIGWITAKQLLKNWRFAVVICAVLAMLITPTVDPVNMTILMIPLITLYFISILFAQFAEKSRRRVRSNPS